MKELQMPIRITLFISLLFFPALSQAVTYEMEYIYDDLNRLDNVAFTPSDGDPLEIDYMCEFQTIPTTHSI